MLDREEMNKEVFQFLNIANVQPDNEQVDQIENSIEIQQDSGIDQGEEAAPEVIEEPRMVCILF